MSMHLHRQIEKLKSSLLEMGTLVEEALGNAIAAVDQRDPALAQSVEEGDIRVDIKELEIEEECLATLALHQPVAQDLRYVVAVLKMNSHLERIGDLAAHIARQAAVIATEPPVALDGFDLSAMALSVQRVLRDSLDAFVRLDDSIAQQVRAADDEIDDMHRSAYAIVERQMQADTSKIGSLSRLVTIVRHLERIADHSVSIAKDVIYLVSGEIVRHSRKISLLKKQQERSESGDA